MFKAIGIGLIVVVTLVGVSAPTSAQVVQAANTSWSKTVNGLAGRVVLARKRVTNGTALIDARLEVRNTTNKPIRLAWSSKRMEFAVVDLQGKNAPRPQELSYSGAAWRKKDLVIPAGGRGVLEMSTGGLGIRADMAGLIDMGPNDCWEFKSSDKDYYLKAVLDIPEGIASGADGGQLWHGRIELPRTLIPLNKTQLLDRARAGELIGQLGAKMIKAPHTLASEEAEAALSLIDDDRVIPWYIKAMESDSSSLRQRALDRLSRFKGDVALEGIRKGMGTQGSDIGNCTTSYVAHQAAGGVRHYAACALARSPHSKAKELLLSMRHDPNVGVRITVMHSFAKMDTKETLDLLKEMSQDSDKRVRGEAKRYLELRKNKPTTQPVQ